MRRSELLGTRWFNLDLTNGLILLPVTKNGESRTVYLSNGAIAVLRWLAAGVQVRPGDKLFPNVTPEQVSMAFKRLCNQLGLEDFRLHDLRHTAASHMRLQGHGIDVIADLLGHKDLRMARRYQHLSPEFLRDAVQSLDEVYGDLCYPGVTAPKMLPQEEERTPGESWRPQQALFKLCNPV